VGSNHKILSLFLLILSFTLSGMDEKKAKISKDLSSPIERLNASDERGKNNGMKFDFSSGSIDMHLSFSRDDIILSAKDKYTFTTFKNKEWKLLNIPGEPAMPYILYRVSIPPNALLSHIEVISATPETLDGNFKIYPAQPPVPISSSSASEFVKEKEEIYESENLYPGRIAGFTHSGTKAGYRIGSFQVFPIQFLPRKQKLVLYNDIELRIHYEPIQREVTPRKRKQVKHFKGIVEDMVINPNDVSKWAPPVGVAFSKALPPGDVDYVIISLSSYEDEWQPLIHWKNKKGVRARFISKSYITSNYSGDNVQEQVKNFIDDANTTWGTTYFILGGDVGDLPHVPCYGYVATSPPTIDSNIASLRFFEDLDNNWDNDNDHIYGESNDGPGGGDVDIYADCYVGRMCIESSSEISNIVDKIIDYEKNPPTGYLNKMLFWTEELWTGVYGYYTADQLEDTLSTQCTYTELYDGQGTYTSDDNAVGTMNTGYGWTVVCSHGDYDEVMQGSLPSKDVTTADLDALLNIQSNKYGIHTGMCCMSGGYHETVDCYGEHFHIDDEGGVAAIFNSEYGWGNGDATSPSSWQGWSNYLMIKFISNIFNRDHYNIGEALGLARDTYIDSITSTGVWRWCLYEYNLLGDPEMPVWTEEPGQLHATHFSNIGVGNQNFSVNVTDGASPVNNARVCLWCKKDSSMWVRGNTNASGNVTLSISPDSTLDTMWVTATKPNYKTYEGFSEVTSGNTKPSIPTLIRIFDNAIIDASPAFQCTVSFVSTDPDNDDIQYEIQWDEAPNFSSPSSKNTGTHSSGNIVTTTIFLGSTPAEAETLFYWKVRASDPDGSGNWSNWSDTRSFTMDMEAEDVYWYQVGRNQFSQCTMNNVMVQGDSVILTQGISGVDTLTYWNPNAATYFYHRQPDSYNDVNYSVRFTPLHSGTLTTAFFWFSHLVGSGNIRIHIWDDSGGYPNIELGYVDYHTDSVNTGGSATVVDLSSLSINVNTSSDFYVGYSLLSGVDTLGLMLDTVGYHSERCYDYWTGHGWEKSDWIHSNMTWLIEATVEYGSEIPEGSLTSPAIVYTDLTTENPNRIDWDGVKWTKSAADDSIGVQIEYKHNGSWSLVPNDSIGAQGGCTNSTGFFDKTSDFCTVDLSLLRPNIYDTLRIKAIFRRPPTKASSDPALKMWAFGNTDDIVTGISTIEKPMMFALNRNQPNPFTRSTTIQYQLARKANVELKVFDVTGRSVITLAKGVQKAGFYSIPWRGSDKNGKSLPSGVYFLRMKAGNFKATQKMLLLR